MSEVPIYLAFRIFGNFHWPPVRTDFDASTNDPADTTLLKKGVVEIYFAPPDPVNPNDLAAYLRWTARNDDLDPLTPDYLTDVGSAVDINASDAELIQAFQNGDAVFRLTNTTPQAGKERRLLFRGAFLFDQFALDATRNVNDPDKPNAPSLDLRWVLARKFTHYNKNKIFGSNFFSEVVIGQSGDTQATGCSIRFNLALPTPGAQSGDDTHRCYALPFAAIFAPKMKMPAPSAAPPTAAFIAGPGPSDSLFDGPAVTVPPKVAKAQLGQFGFCAGVGAGTTEFLYFPRYTHQGDFRFYSFWPTGAQAFVQDFLGILSQSAPPGSQPEKYLALDTDANNHAGELSHSVRFRFDSGQTVMTFRTKVTVPPQSIFTSGPANLTPDLRVDFGVDRPLSFQLHAPHRDEWLHTRTDTLHIEREIAYTIPDQAIWSFADTDQPAAAGQITVRLGFAEKRNDGGATDVVYLKDLFARATAATQLPRIDLRNMSDGQPQSILPSFGITWSALPDFGGSPDPVTPRFLLCGVMQFEFQKPSASGTIGWKTKYPNRKIWAGLDLDLGLWPDAHNIDIDKKDSVVPGRLDITLSPVSFSYTSDPLKVSLVADPSVPSGDRSQWGRFRIAPGATKSAVLTARLGGLEFAAAADNRGVYKEPADSPSDYSYWRFGDRSFADAPPSLPPTNVDLRLRLPIATIRPIVTDTPWGDRSGDPAPLLIPLGESAGGGHFVLDLRETVAQSQDRQLTASIYDTGEGSSDSGDYVILSEGPFSIIRLHSQPLQDRGTQDNTLVATFDSDTRQWQVKLTAETYHYAFPPQVAGESMDKPRRLEIADYDPGPPTTGMPPAIAPVDLKSPDDAPGKPSDPNNHPFAVEFRLTPSAEVWIRPSDLERGYFLPEWASHEIFRQRGDLGVGAAMVGLRGEFLYGLSVGIDPSRESGAARSARVAEIEALLGKPPRKLGVANTSTALAKRWTALDHVIARRPERIEIWAQDPNSSVPLAPAKFADGVTFSLRETALHRPAVPLSKDELKGLDQPNSGKPRVSNDGLSGGALWPLESKNFFNAMIQNPTSGGGTIEQIALSPIGGDANQKAEFLNGKVRIISETRNGFVQRHKVEIIGRISVFWHWAKHVVVYERTVNPSAQFTPDGGVLKRTRRPVLRKVSEYIYIRQPQGIRRYPDFPSAEASSSGLLKAVKFNCIAINVDSAWSEDVGQYGWRIPLWNRDAARRRPQVYPCPDIAFSTFAEGQGEEAEASQECVEPDNIYFYADASPTTGADTDSWPSLAGIDCSLLPPPADAFQRALDPHDQPGDGNATKPGAPRIPRGHRRFTWRLAPPSKKTALNAGRSDKPLFAGLESITFMRSNAQEATDPHKTTIKTMTDALKDADAIGPPKTKLDYWSPNAKAPTAFAEVNDFMDAVTTDPTKIQATAQKLADALKTGILKRPGVQDGIDAATGYAKALSPIAKFVTKDPTSRCARMADDLVGSVQRKQLLILDAVGTWQADAEKTIPSAPPNPATVAKLKANLTADLAKIIRRAFGEVGFDPGQIELGATKARSILDDFEDDVRQAETTLQLQLHALKTAYDDNKPWSASRIQEFETKWIAAGNRVMNGIRTAIEEGGARVTAELDDLAQTIANTLHDAMLSLLGADSTVKNDVNNAYALSACYLDAAIGKLDAFLAVTNGKDALNVLDDKLADFQASIQVKYPSQATALGDVRHGLTNIRTSAETVRAYLQTVRSSNPQIAITALVDATVAQGLAILNGIASAVSQSNAVLGSIVDDTVKDAIKALQDALADFTQVVDATVAIVRDFGTAIDGVTVVAFQRIQTALQTGVFGPVDSWFARINDAKAYASDKLAQVTQTIDAGLIATMVTDHILTPALNSALAEVTDAVVADYQNTRERIITLVGDTSGYVQSQINQLSASALGEAQKTIVDACSKVAGGLDQVVQSFQTLENEISGRAAELAKRLTDNINDVVKLGQIAAGLANEVRRLNNDIATSYASAAGYSNRVLEAAGNLGAGGVGAVPGNILRLYAAAASPPALPNLEFARDRLGYYYNQLNDVIDTTPAEAWFGRIGDELKALGLSLPFSKLGDGILPDDLSNFDISRIFKNFSGMKLDKLFQGYKLPPGAKDAIKLTHAFDKAQARAWVEIDVDLPMTDRKAMFSVGPFELDYVNSRFVAMVRLEASKDTNSVDQIGRAALTTDLEAVVGGETMVTFQQVGLHYEKSSGLKVEFDPKKIRLNAIFQFIEDTLGSIFPDELGGLKIIKEFGIPVGIEHEFAMPPISLNYATSGVSNICINNRFGLVAFPEFVIYDRFSLSRPELPFIFSIFIIGGTGYITVDAEYHPFQDNGLMVMVEAGAGGSAQLGFAFGPVSGQVLITLSVALAYKKVFGRPGGGLTISLVLLIAGNVDIAGIVTIYIGLLLRMSYQDTGAIDATGTLTVTIHITRFFKIEVSANVQYRLRGGQSQTTTSVQANAGVDSAAIADAGNSAGQLLDARG